MRWTCVLVLAACGGGDPAIPDAALADAAPDGAIDAAIDAPDDAIDLTCLGQPPIVLPGAMAIAGKVFAVASYEVAPEVGAVVELRRSNDDGLVGSATTTVDGEFSIDAPGAVDGYFIVTANGKVTTRASSDTPLVAGDDALLLVADVAELARWYGDAGTTHAAGARTAIVAVRDCARDTVAGSTLGLVPASPVTYYDDQAKRWDPALATSTNGFALIPSAPASITVTPRLGATAFPAETLVSLPDVLTLVVVSPFD